jgi:hypothetical protein
MSQRHVVKYQCTIPASLTKTPQAMLDRTIKSASEYLRGLVGPGGYNFQVSPIYAERKTKLLGTVWDLNVVLFFDFKGPMPEHLKRLVQFAKIQKQLREGKGN